MGTFLEDMNRGLREKEKKPMGFANAARLNNEWRDIHLADYPWLTGGYDDSRYIGNVWDFGAPQIASTGMANPDYVPGGLPHGRPRETIGKTWDAYYGDPEAKHDIARAGKNYTDVEDYWDKIMYPMASVHSWENDLGVDGDPNRETITGLPAWDTDDYYARKRANAPAWWKGRMY